VTLYACTRKIMLKRFLLHFILVAHGFMKKYGTLQSFYFTDDGLEDSSIFSSPAGQKNFDYATAATSLGSATASQTDSIFDQNDTIPAFQLVGSSYQPYIGAGYFGVPQPDFSGLCNDNNYAQFEVNADVKSCTRYLGNGDVGNNNTVTIKVEDFVNACSDQSLARYVNAVVIGKNADTVSTTSGDLLSVTLQSLSYEDPITGDLTDVLQSWNTGSCTTTSYLDVEVTAADVDASNYPCLFGSSYVTANFLGDTVDMCSGIVRSVVYTIRHNSTGNNPIISVLADVIVTDIVLSSSVAARYVFQQSFGIEFVGEHGMSPTALNGNQINRYVYLVSLFYPRSCLCCVVQGQIRKSRLPRWKTDYLWHHFF
jgi:hypothetical protein